MTAWLTQHARGLRAALARFAGAPFGSLFNVLVIGFALALPFGFYVALDGVQTFALRGLDASGPQLSVFMALDASRDDAAGIGQQLGRDPRVAKFRFVPRAQALQELKQSSGLADAIDSLPQNPLPDAFVVVASDRSSAALAALRDEIQVWPHVAYVQLDSAWAQRLDALLRIGRFATALLAAVFAIVLAAVAFNTIRLQILTQRDEIEVAKLIGATDAFIRRPLLYFGVLLGLAGGGAAWLLVVGGVALLNHEIGTIAQPAVIPFQFGYPGFNASVILFAAAAALGWLGAWLSAGRHIALLEAESK
ncbi:MAG TPA: permease-like cell division protein FtsX [Burkholderiales bacterium]|nr:permease-like cell division protein FtsX [Burkholderiales bacterium]